MADTRELESFHEMMRTAQGEFVRGNPERFKAMWSQGDDVTIMGAFGAYERGWAEVGPRLTWASSQFRDGTWEGEGVSAFIGDDIAAVVRIERTTAFLGGSTTRTVQELRVTHVLRREAGEWKIVHRHGDALRPTEAPR